MPQRIKRYALSILPSPEWSLRDRQVSHKVASQADLSHTGPYTGPTYDSNEADVRIQDDSYRYSGYSCPQCPAIFQSRVLLRKHISQAHSAVMPYSCSVCGKGYLSYQGRDLHMQTHKKERKTFPCPMPECPRHLSQKCHIKGHLKSVHGAAQCMYCKTVLPCQDYNVHVSQCIGANI